MGTWGDKPFQNDAALDWLAELEARGVSAVRDALSSVVEERRADDFIDADDGAHVVAAAEVAAAARAGTWSGLPSQAGAWLDQHAAAIGADDLRLARLAVTRVLHDATSELRALWAQQGEPSVWHEQIRDLLARLGGDPGPVPSAQPSGAQGGDDAQMRQALLAFMQMRGLVPTDAQLARIHAEGHGAALRRWLARAVDAPSVEALLAD